MVLKSIISELLEITARFKNDLIRLFTPTNTVNSEFLTFQPFNAKG